jgi:hypothetical protein
MMEFWARSEALALYWNIGFLLHRIEKYHVFDHYSSIPLFHYSIIPLTRHITSVVKRDMLSICY